MKRTKKAIYPVIALFIFSGAALLLGIFIVMAGLGGYQPRLGIYEIAFLTSVFIALVSYGFVFTNFTKQLFLYKWNSLLLCEKLSALVLIIMISPVYSTVETIWHIVSVYLKQNA